MNYARKNLHRNFLHSSQRHYSLAFIHNTQNYRKANENQLYLHWGEGAWEIEEPYAATMQPKLEESSIGKREG